MSIKVTKTGALFFFFFISMAGVGLFLPVMQPMIEEAKYMAEAKPVISAIQTKVELFRYDKGFLPGADRDAAGVLRTNDASPWATSTLAPNRKGNPGQGGLQGFMAVSTAVTTNSEGSGSYIPAVVAWEGNTLTVRPVAPSDAAHHFAEDLNVDFDDFVGMRLRPSHFFYRTDQSGCTNGGYIYAVGVFGDGNRLRMGTGYAVLQIVNPSAHIKCIETWGRYRAVKGAQSQVPMLTAQEWTNPPTDKDNVCWIGDVTTNGLMSPDPEKAKRALAALHEAGWVF